MWMYTRRRGHTDGKLSHNKKTRHLSNTRERKYEGTTRGPQHALVDGRSKSNNKMDWRRERSGRTLRQGVGSTVDWSEEESAGSEHSIYTV